MGMTSRNLSSPRPVFYLKILKDSAVVALKNRTSRKLMPRKRVLPSRILWTGRIVFMMFLQPKILKWSELSKKAIPPFLETSGEIGRSQYCFYRFQYILYIL